MKPLAQIPFGALDRALGRAPRAAESPASESIDSIGARAVPFDEDARAELAETLERALAALEPPVAALEAARALARPGASVVLAATAPGFLCGPNARAFAALSALRLARTLETATERPHVAVSWCAVDETDAPGIHPAWIRNEHDDLRRVGLASVSGTVPFDRIVLDEERHRVGAARALLAQTLERAPHAAAAIERFAPRAGETWARAFTRALSDALGPLGLVVVEPEWLRAPLSRATAEVLAPRRRDRAAPLAELWSESGGDPGAPVVRRFGQPLRLGGDGLRYDGEPGSRNLRELAAEIVQEPEAFAPAAALFPLVAERVLPVAAHVDADPMPWLDALAAWHGRERAPVVRPFGATLVEPAVAQSLERAGLAAEDALLAGPALVEREAPPPSDVVLRLDAIAERATGDLAALARELGDDDRPLAHGLRRTSRRVRDEIAATRERARRLHANRHGKSARHLRRIAGALRPQGLLQEEVLGPLPLAAQWGLDVLERVFEHVPPAPDGHAVLAVGE